MDGHGMRCMQKVYFSPGETIERKIINVMVDLKSMGAGTRDSRGGRSPCNLYVGFVSPKILGVSKQFCVHDLGLCLQLCYEVVFGFVKSINRDSYR